MKIVKKYKFKIYLNKLMFRIEDRTNRLYLRHKMTINPQ